MQNDMRDRLIDLLYEAEGQVNNDYPTVEQIADYLIAKGVILPPCKVGDKVYEIVLTKKGNGHINEHKVVGFHIGDFPKLRGQTRKQYLIGHCEVMNFIFHIDMKQLGKTVFLTKEEAEQKLKEMRADNGNL